MEKRIYIEIGSAYILFPDGNQHPTRSPSIETSQRDIANKTVPDRDKTPSITLTVIHVQTNGRVHRLHARVVTCNQQLKGAPIHVCGTTGRKFATEECSISPLSDTSQNCNGDRF
ncbi:hypothetical protein TNCV_2485811 [Trichonephila clavipes]|uniref:Uncharacterized protein n=1 Tax=Trichonephila clavipes TaxID=2585209 RepID=A0A8X6W005_TRICX|nr:hypothetical protein TNCV_2485811 [Trichonephila clavipes]